MAIIVFVAVSVRRCLLTLVQYVKYHDVVVCVCEQILQICTDMTNVLSSLQAHCGRGPDVALFPIVVGR